MRYLLLYHLGLGDHIIMNGLVHSIRKYSKEKIDEICILANKHFKVSLDHLYEDFKGLIRLHYMESGLNSSETDPLYIQIHEKPPFSKAFYDGNEYVCIPFGNHSIHKNIWRMTNYDWNECLYLFPLQIQPEMRFREFHLPRDMSRSIKKYTSLVERIQTTKYILIHDDPSRNRNVKGDLLRKKMEEDNMIQYPVLYLGLKRYNYPLVEGLNNPDVSDILTCDSLLDLFVIMFQASACHFMDSSMACLADVANIQCKLYHHRYILGVESGKPFRRAPWIHIDSSD